MDAFSSIFSNPLFGKLIVPIATASGVLLVLFLFWRRADSLHAVWEKVWRLIAGGADVQEPRLRAFMQEMRDLEKFRLVYGLSITNMADMHRFIAWVRRHRLDIAVLQKARRWVDISKPGIISRPPKSHFAWNGAWLVLSAVLVQSAILFAISPAILKMNASGVWFSSDGAYVRTPLGSNKLELTQCATITDKLEKTFHFTTHEIKALCEAYADGSLQRLATKTMTEQKTLGAFVVFVAGTWLLVAMLRIRSAETAERIADRVGQPRRQAPQTSAPQTAAFKRSDVPKSAEERS